jgi:hypothetical protein
MHSSEAGARVGPPVNFDKWQSRAAAGRVALDVTWYLVAHEFEQWIMAHRREGGRLFELNLADWLVLSGGVALAAIVTLLFLIR